MDSRKRSVAKGLTWRALAMLDTVLLALIFTGNIGTAFSIGGLELITKLVWYYLHERLWVWIPAEYERYPRLSRLLDHNRRTRSFIKAVTWRFFGALDTFLIAFVLTGEVGVSSSIGLTELATKIILYYLHERAWAHVHWGIQKKGAYQSTSRLRNFFDVLREQYRVSMTVIFAVLCLLFVLLSAFFIYGLNSLITHTT